jgi:hypothetical protein
MKPERRRSPRENLHSLVYFDLEPSNGGIVLDLGEGGMRISLAHPLAGAEEIRFSLRVGPGERVQGTGCIAWISPSGKNAGVRFVSLEREALRQILPSLGVQAETPESTSGGSEQQEHAPPVEAGSAVKEAETVSTPVPPQPEIVAKPSEMTAGPEPCILSLYGQDGREDEFHVAQEPTSGRAADDAVQKAPEGEVGARAGVPAPQGETAGVAGLPESAGEPTANNFSPESFVRDSADLAREGAEERDITVLPEDAQSTTPGRRPTPAPPPAWLEALIEAGRRERWEDVLPGAGGAKEESKPEPPEPEPAEQISAPAANDAQAEEPLLGGDSTGALYLPNYQVEADHATGDVRLRKFDLRDGSQMAANLACERLEEFGWTLERDWHIWVALVLLVAGFLALAQKPPLALIAGVLWLASAFIAVKRKQRPRPEGTSGPDRQ